MFTQGSVDSARLDGVYCRAEYLKSIDGSIVKVEIGVSPKTQ